MSRRLFSIIEGKREKSKPCFLVGPLFFVPEKLWNMSKKLQTKAICPKQPLKFSDFAERKFRRARFLKKETTNPLFEKTKKLILETEKHTALPGRTCLPRLCLTRSNDGGYTMKRISRRNFLKWLAWVPLHWA